MLNPDKLRRKQIDPTAAGQGTAGVLPIIPDLDRALVTLDDSTLARMRQEYDNGEDKGQTTHNKYLDPYFSWMPGFLNVITGWPGHGKSQFFFELLLLRAVFEGKKSAVWPSENLPPHRFYKNLVHTLTGRPTDRIHTNALTWPEYERAANFIKRHIFLIDVPSGMPYTPAHMLAYFDALTKRHGVEHCLLDPWNKCDHTAMPKMGGIEPYLIHALGLLTKWSQDVGQCLVVTAHPKRADEQMGYGKTRPVPTGGTISGGQTWENAAHYVGALHRPFDYIEGSTQAAYYCLKCKDERNVARRGSVGAMGLTDGLPPQVPLNWDPISNRYRWGRERWSPLDDPDVARLYAPPPPPTTGQLFSPAPAPTPPLYGAATDKHGYSAPAASVPPLRLAAPSSFDEPTAPANETLPADWHPNGRIISTAPNDATK